MPVVVDAVVMGELPDRRPVTVRRLLGGVVHDPDASHGDQDKPYRAGELCGDGPGRFMWRLGWCRQVGSPESAWPDEPPWHGLKEGVRIGARRDVVVRELGRREATFGDLSREPARREATMLFQTPTVFRRSARPRSRFQVRRMWPLPDPVMVFDSVARAWNSSAPAGLMLDEQLTADVLDHVELVDFDGIARPIGQGAPATVSRIGIAAEGNRMRRAWEASGFVGRVRFGVARGAPELVVRVFTALLLFAPFCGVGALRTYGFGSVEVEDADPAGVAR